MSFGVVSKDEEGLPIPIDNISLRPLAAE